MNRLASFAALALVLCACSSKRAPSAPAHEPVMAQPNEPDAYVLDYADVFHLLNERAEDRSDFTGKRVRFRAQIMKVGFPGELAPCGHLLVEDASKPMTAIRCDLRCTEHIQEMRKGDPGMFIGSPHYTPLGGWLTECGLWKQ